MVNDEGYVYVVILIPTMYEKRLMSKREGRETNVPFFPLMLYNQTEQRRL
jgi:hypothetical protein